eukprot:TRINITY_DN1933_c0_g1_i1.p1 TRINITY_DN1933_c0_g1~~TRINITY_DN1933_c0_g1_i1.p1  ORF type:complete len:1546 (+),score=580.29 TRINITY_DN1933_c0_g1_i1:69-4706(+)
MSADASSERVKVYIRIRPFSERERREDAMEGRESTQCVLVESSTVSMADPRVAASSGIFSFDGVLHSTDEQLKTYEAVCPSFVRNTLNGYNCTLLAYGQTGSGKTHTMMGAPGSMDGVVPRLCKDLYDAMAKVGSDGWSHSVTLSYMEIYNDDVFDLLSDPGKAGLQPMQLREGPDKALHPVGITAVPCDTAQDVLTHVQAGNLVRHTASTKMNARSSRSHALVQLKVKSSRGLERDERKELGDTVEADTRMAKLNLVDLAGSERVEKSGVQGKDFQDTIGINTSLFFLGSVIRELAQSIGAVNYRNSRLTHVLRDSLGGNAKTSLVATISPHQSNADETLSTLRFAALSQKVVNRAVVNEDPAVREIRRLTAELAKYKGDGRRRKGLTEEEQSEIVDLKAEVESLRAENQRLREMVASLRQQVSEGGSKRSVASSSPVPQRRPPPRQSAPAKTGGFASTPSQARSQSPLVALRRSSRDISAEEPAPAAPKSDGALGKKEGKLKQVKDEIKKESAELQRVKDMIQGHDQAKSDVEATKAQLDLAVSKLKKVKEDSKQAGEKLKERRGELERLVGDIGEKKECLAQIDAELSHKRKKQGDLADLAETKASLTRVRKDLEGHRDKLSQEQERTERLQEELSAVLEAKEAEEEEARRGRSANDALRRDAEELRQRVRALEEEDAERKAEMARTEEECSQELEALKAELSREQRRGEESREAHEEARTAQRDTQQALDLVSADQARLKELYWQLRSETEHGSQQRVTAVHEEESREREMIVRSQLDTHILLRLTADASGSEVMRHLHLVSSLVQVVKERDDASLQGDAHKKSAQILEKQLSAQQDEVRSLSSQKAAAEKQLLLLKEREMRLSSRLAERDQKSKLAAAEVMLSLSAQGRRMVWFARLREHSSRRAHIRVQHRAKEFEQRHIAATEALSEKEAAVRGLRMKLEISHQEKSTVTTELQATKERIAGMDAAAQRRAEMDRAQREEAERAHKTRMAESLAAFTANGTRKGPYWRWRRWVQDRNTARRRAKDLATLDKLQADLELQVDEKQKFQVEAEAAERTKRDLAHKLAHQQMTQEETDREVRRLEEQKQEYRKKAVLTDKAVDSARKQRRMRKSLEVDYSRLRQRYSVYKQAAPAVQELVSELQVALKESQTESEILEETCAELEGADERCELLEHSRALLEREVELLRCGASSTALRVNELQRRYSELKERGLDALGESKRKMALLFLQWSAREKDELYDDSLLTLSRQAEDLDERLRLREQWSQTVSEMAGRVADHSGALENAVRRVEHPAEARSAGVERVRMQAEDALPHEEQLRLEQAALERRWKQWRSQRASVKGGIEAVMALVSEAGGRPLDSPRSELLRPIRRPRGRRDLPLSLDSPGSRACSETHSIGPRTPLSRQGSLRGGGVQRRQSMRQVVANSPRGPPSGLRRKESFVVQPVSARTTPLPNFQSQGHGSRSGTPVPRTDSTGAVLARPPLAPGPVLATSPHADPLRTVSPMAGSPPVPLSSPGSDAPPRAPPVAGSASGKQGKKDCSVM